MESGWLGRRGKAEITSHPDQNASFATGPGGQTKEIGLVGLYTFASALTLNWICC